MKTAVIIGAGPAGLTSAYELLNKTDVKPIILEETSFVGGISRTVEYKSNRMDLGGHRFFTKNEYINKLWGDICPGMMTRPRSSRIFYLGKFFDYPISLKLQTLINLGVFRTLKVGTSYMKSVIFKRKENNLENFMTNRFGITLYRMFFENYTEKLWGRHPKEIDASWGAQRIKGLSITKLIVNALRLNKQKENSLIDEFLYPQLGPGELYEKMADEITKLDGNIVFNTKVERVNIKNNKIVSVIAGGIEHKADYFFSSMPIKDLCLAMNEIPKEYLEIAKNLPYRDFITVGLLCRNLEIDKPYPKDNWIYIQEPTVKMGRLQIFNNWSPHLVKDGNTVWIGLEYFVNENDDLWNMTEKDFTFFAISELTKIGIIKAKNVLDSTCIKVKKAYPAYFDSYKDFPKLKNWLCSIKNLYCIGRNGQHRYNNMDHSMLTAVVAIDSLINNRETHDCWNVNTDMKYHEEKREKRISDKLAQAA